MSNVLAFKHGQLKNNSLKCPNMALRYSFKATNYMQHAISLNCLSRHDVHSGPQYIMYIQDYNTSCISAAETRDISDRFLFILHLMTSKCRDLLRKLRLNLAKK
jgi:hypothetical protein